MRSLHQSGVLQVLSGTPRALHLEGVLQLQARQAGWLQVEAAAVWITRVGDADDHVLGAGEGLWLGRGEQVLVEPWQPSQPAGLRWAVGPDVPALQALAGLRRGVAEPRPLVDAAWRVLARGLGAAAGRLAAAARSAEAMASRAQGSIRPGDSIASSGALQ